VAQEREGVPYSKDELFDYGPQRTFSRDALAEIAFPLGGIGTGCVSLGGRGQLRDWEIFNRPNLGFRPPWTLPILRVETEGREPVMKLLESMPPPPYSGTHGFLAQYGAGLPHVASNTFRGEYPFAWLEFEDAGLPLKVSLEAFNPFIPLDVTASSLPAAILTYRMENTSDRPVEATVLWSVQNLLGYLGAGEMKPEDLGGNRNRFRSGNGLSAMLMDSARYPEDSHRSGTLVVGTPREDVTWTGRIGPYRRFWGRLAETGRLDEVELSEPTEQGRSAVCALGARVRLQPGETAEAPFIFAWHFPNFRFLKGWQQPEPSAQVSWRTWYAQRFEDALEVAAHVAENLPDLRAESMKYHDALFNSTLPAPVLDAASSQTSTIKSPTCLLLEDGTFYGFEGCSATVGCCHGSCTHVWNYQQALPFLFPTLERSMRTADYKYNLREEDGRMCFRIGVPLGSSDWEFHAAADGQLGGIMKTYRDWLLSGDDEWLRRLWPRVKKSLSYAWQEWDADRDGVPEGRQHNTYDIEFYGPNPLIGAFYLGALRAAEEMALYLGEEEQAHEYRDLFEKGSSRMDEMLFNGQYYEQQYDPAQSTENQFGKGCLADQMLGQWIASICGLGYLFNPQNVKSALRSVFRYNWRASLADHVSLERLYAVDDEAGLLLCTWPLGGRPETPVRYCDEVWTGIEYQVASHLITEGFVEEGLAIVKGARDRHDGRKRNPWNEPECGAHYARAMSSWGLMLALSGYFCDASRGLLQFGPKVHARAFRTFWSNAAAWGVYEQTVEGKSAEVTLEALHGELELKALRLGLDAEVTTALAELSGAPVDCAARKDKDWIEVSFDKALTMPAGRKLRLRLA